MLLSVTSNPTIDRMLRVPRLTPGQVHRAEEVHCSAGGKGLNVARAARVVGGQVLVTGPLGGHTGRQVAELAENEGLAADWFWRQSGETRNCILINHTALDTTVVNEPGSDVTEQDWSGFETHVTRLAATAGAVAFSGSHPPGVAPERLGALARRLASGHRAVYLDSSAAALKAALREPCRLCVKVNGQELLDGMGLAGPPALERIVRASRLLIGSGAELVVATLGSQGATALAGERGWRVEAPGVEVVSSVGSGDAFLAAFAVTRLKGGSLPEALAWGAACGAANATTPLPARFPFSLARALADRVRVEEL